MIKSDIQEFIDEEINPSLQMHGGYILIESFDENTNILKPKPNIISNVTAEEEKDVNKIKTFLIDQKGVIKVRHVGALTPDVWEKKFKGFLGSL